MSREILLKHIIESLAKLPDQKLKKVSGFAEFLLYKIEDKIIVDGIQKLAAQSKPYLFLETEEDIYTVNDLKEVYK